VVPQLHSLPLAHAFRGLLAAKPDNDSLDWGRARHVGAVRMTMKYKIGDEGDKKAHVECCSTFDRVSSRYARQNAQQGGASSN
jgi:hypothetical protein